jgi:hypothetical protein
MNRLETDGRMFWMRMLDGPEENSNVLEAELSSEVMIPGLLNYRSGSIVAKFSTVRRDPSGMYKYGLRLRTPASVAEKFWTEPKRDGYIFRKGPVGELIALFSLSLQARLYLLWTGVAVMADGIPVKNEHWPIRGRAGLDVDPIVFSETDRNFTNSLPPLLDCLIELPVKYHQRIITAAEHYGRALRYIGIDDEMVYVRLVSAVETVARDQPVPGDLFEGVRAEQVLKLDELSEDQQGELRRTFDTRKSKARFVEFLVQYSKGFFDGEAREPVHTQVTPENLPKIAAAIYNARSGYLHNGDPMYISPGVPMFPSWHMDASVGMIDGEREFVAKQKLPYLVFAHRLVRHCLLTYIRSLVPGTTQRS